MKKFFLIFGIVLLVIIIAGILFICLNKDKLISTVIDKSFGMMENVVINSLPETVSQDSVRVLFGDAIQAIKSGEANKEAIQSLSITFQKSMQDKQLDSLEVATILDKLKTLKE